VTGFRAPFHPREADSASRCSYGAAVRISPPRSGVTLLELMVVLALLIILAAVAIPSLAGLKGNSDQKNASDQVRARIADARGLAMQEAVPYQLAVSSDGTKMRVAPDTSDFGSTPCSDESTGGAKAIETCFKNATVAVIEDSDFDDTADNWVTIAVFLPNGTCRAALLEDGTTRNALPMLEVRETGFPPVHIQIRGLTGTSSVQSAHPSNGGMK
jgi:Tfp pilus assembly protein FimT